MQQNSNLEQGSSSRDNASYSGDESVFQSTSKQTDGKDNNFLETYGSIGENNMSSSFVVNIGKDVVRTCMFTYLLLYYSVCQALFMLLMLTVKQTGNEFRKKLKLQGYQDDENGNSGLSKVKYLILKV